MSVSNMKKQRPPISIHCNYEGLDISNVSTLIQSGIKLFLHQRNQIPLPLEQLAKLRSSKPKPSNLTAGELEGSKFDQTSSSVDKLNTVDEQKLEEHDELDPRERIQLMQSIRRSRILSKKGERFNERAAKQELEASNSITTALKDLDGLLMIFPEVQAVCLVFGSLYSPKEVVLFQFEIKHRTANNNQDMSPLTRNFYKNIIMSDGFLNFTEKNLPPTKIHICLIAPEEIEHRNIVCVSENLNWIRQLMDTSYINSSKKCNTLNVKLTDLLLESAHCYQLTTSIRGVMTRRR